MAEGATPARRAIAPIEMPELIDVIGNAILHAGLDLKRTLTRRLRIANSSCDLQRFP
jgi:hypothetical protein